MRTSNGVVGEKGDREREKHNGKIMELLIFFLKC